MEEKNVTSWKVFLLLGLQYQKSPTIFLVAISFMFFIAIIGNCLLLFVINADSSLDTPMYFFLKQLALLDLCQIFTIVPQVFVSFVTKRYTISLYGCATQITVTLLLGGAECLILATMSYDRYVAICKPLQYPILTRKSILHMMSVVAWFWSMVQALSCSLYVLYLPYCKSNIIKRYICVFPALIQLSCSDRANSIFKVAVNVGDFLVLLLPLLVIFSSYIAILLQVLRVHSSERSHKALTTCLSHLCVVGFFYGAAIVNYMTSASSYSAERSMINAVFITIVPATMNPFIYSLRNQDVVATLKKLFGKCKQCK